MGSNAEFAINNVDFGKTVSRAEHLGLRDLAVIAWRDLEAPDSGVDRLVLRVALD